MKSKFVTIDPKFFKHLIHSDGYNYTFKSLSKKLNVDNHVFTRMKKSRKIKIELLDKISQILNLDTDYVRGAFLNNNFKTDEYLLKWKYGVERLDKYPFYNINSEKAKKFSYKSKVEKTQSSKNLSHSLNRLFILMDVPFKAYENLSTKEQISFLKDFYYSIYPVFKNNFPNIINDKNNSPCSFATYIEYKEEAEEDRQIAESIRKKYSKNPPVGYSLENLKCFSDREIIDLDYCEQMKKRTKCVRSYLAKNPPTGYTKKMINSLTDYEVEEMEQKLLDEKYFSKKYKH